MEKCTTQFRSIKTTTIKPTPVKRSKNASFDLRGKENSKYYSPPNQKSNQNKLTNYSSTDYQPLQPQQQQSPEKQQNSEKKPGKTTTLSFDLETPCCKIFRKAIEKVLVRYEKPPVDYLSSVDQQFFSLSSSENLELKKIIKKEMMATLSRYLHHERWIWTPESLSRETGKTIPLNLLGKVLAELLRYWAFESFGRMLRICSSYVPPIDSKFSYTGNDWMRAFTWRTIVAMASSTWRSR